MLKRLIAGFLAVGMMVLVAGQVMAASVTIKLPKGSNGWQMAPMDNRITMLKANVGAGQYVYVRWNELSGNGMSGYDVNMGSMQMMPIGRDGNPVPDMAIEHTVDSDTGWYEFRVPATGNYAIVYSPRPMFMPDMFAVKAYFVDYPMVTSTLD